MLASEAGLGGFVSTIAATLAGSYVNAELMSQAKVETPENEKSKLPKIETNSSISYDHNGRGFRAENLDFNKEEVAQLVNEIKARVFDDAFDRNLPTEEAVKEVQKTTKEAEEFLEKEEVKETVKELKKINKKLKKVEEKQKKLEDETPRLKVSTEAKSEVSKTPDENVGIASEILLKAETIENRTYSLDEKKVEEYQQVLSEKNILAKKALDLGVLLKDRIDSFATDHGWNSSVKNVLIKGLQAIGVGAAIGAAAAVATEAGLVAGLTAGAGIFIAGEATAKVTDLSAEAAVTYAISQADTEEEAQSYADLVMSMVEWGVIGLSAVGAYKGVKGKAPALRNTFSKAKISELFGLSRAKKTATASASGASASKNVVALDWVGVETKGLPAYRHIELEHAKFRPTKVKNGVFYGDPKAKIDLAWQRAQELGIKPIQKVQHGGTFDYYIVPLENAGYEYSGGLAKSFTGKEINPVFPNTNCDYVTIVTKSGTNKLKTAYPSSRTANLKVKE